MMIAIYIICAISVPLICTLWFLIDIGRTSARRCKDCKHIKLLTKGYYRLDKINWVSPCMGCLQTVTGENYDIKPEDHLHYTRKWWKIWRGK